MNDLLKRLGMGHISDFFDEAYKKALCDPAIPTWLTEDFLRDGAKEFGYFKSELEALVNALPYVVQNDSLVLFAKTLYIMLEDRRFHEECFAGLEFPTAPDGESPLPYDIFSFYPMFARIREAMASIRNSGVDEEVIKTTYEGIDGCIKASTRLEGRFSFNKTYFLWCTLYKNAVLFKIDRFSFELREGCKLDIYAFINDNDEIKIMMKGNIEVHQSGRLLGSAGAKERESSFTTEYEETDKFYIGNLSVDGIVNREKTALCKAEWKPFYQPGDSLISVHIPSSGAFDRVTVANSIEKGRAFFKKLYPNKDIKGFMCISWLLDPNLKKILKPESNILAFQDIYTKFPYLSEALDVFHFVFEKSVTKLSDLDLDSLPETTSLMKGIKDMYKSGEYIYEIGGIFK